MASNDKRHSGMSGMENGHVKQTNEAPAARELSLAQREHLMMLVGQMNTTHAEMEAAQQLHEAATANANNFLAYCAREHGVNSQPWRFVQEQMRFVYDPLPEDAASNWQNEPTPPEGAAAYVA